MEKLFSFMEGTIGRGLRILLGAAIILVGFGVIGGAAGAAVAFIGVIPILMGFWGPCLLHMALEKKSRARTS